jgi:hypothetical protein
MTIIDKPVVINIESIDDWTITSLRKACAKNHVKGYTKMDKSQLVDEVKKLFADLGGDQA